MQYFPPKQRSRMRVSAMPQGHPVVKEMRLGGAHSPLPPSRVKPCLTAALLNRLHQYICLAEVLKPFIVAERRSCARLRCQDPSLPKQASWTLAERICLSWILIPPSPRDGYRELFFRYDVAHVLKWSRFKHVRMEFARAYASLAQSASMGGVVAENVPRLLETICSQASDWLRGFVRLDAGVRVNDWGVDVYAREAQNYRF